MQRNHKINEKRLRRIHSIWAYVARIYVKAGKEAILARGATSKSTTTARKAVIFKGEMDFISRCILDRKNIETGGQLFGYWTENGTPVILYAIGPGPRANHQVTFFNQDVDYLVKVGNILRNRYGLHHIGEWHSHHQLGLAKPSGHDSDNMTSVIKRRDLGEFLLCIGNCDNFSSSLNAFLCDSSECRCIAWDYVMADSPLRHVIDNDLGRLISKPLTVQARHKDLILNQ